MLKANYHSKYNTIDKNNKGIVMFRYLVSGKPEELAQYKTAQGDFFRENEEGNAMYFTQNYIGDHISLGITSKGKVYADTAPLDKINSLCSRYPGILGVAIAQLGAQQILGNLMGSGATIQQPVDQLPTQEENGKLDE